MARRHLLDTYSSTVVGNRVFGIDGSSGRPHREPSFLNPSALSHSYKTQSVPRFADPLTRQQLNANPHKTRGVVR